MSLASGQATAGSDLLRCTMPTLFWDIETRSVVSLETAGASRYASDPTTEILCVGYAIDDNDPKIWLLGDPIPPEIETATHVVAHNFQFERAILTHKLEPLGWPRIPLERQRCSMTLCLVNALPGALDNAATALGIPLQKDREGYKLMRRCRGHCRAVRATRRTSFVGMTTRKTANASRNIANATSSSSAWYIAHCPRCRLPSKRCSSSTPSSTSADFMSTSSSPGPRARSPTPSGSRSTWRSPRSPRARSRPLTKSRGFSHLYADMDMSFPASPNALLPLCSHTNPATQCDNYWSSAEKAPVHRCASSTHC